MSHANVSDLCQHNAVPLLPWEEKFKDGVFAVFRRWALIRLVITQELAGTFSRDKVNQMLEELFALLLNRQKRPLTLIVDANGNGGDKDLDKLAEWLRCTMYEKCCCELEDDSDEEVARKLLHLLDTCRRNDFTAADQEILLADQQDTQCQNAANACVQQDNTIYDDGTGSLEEIPNSFTGGAPELGVIGEGDDDGESDEDMMDVEMGEEGQQQQQQMQQQMGGQQQMGCGGDMQQMQQQQMMSGMHGMGGMVGAMGGVIGGGNMGQNVVPVPVIDNDGFETVVKGRRR